MWAEGHVLLGARVIAVAVKRHLKEVVYWLPESGQWAWVHLTYAVEANPHWPSAVIVSEWSELVEQMIAE